MSVICRLPGGSFIKAKPILSLTSTVGSDQAGYIQLHCHFQKDERRKGYKVMVKEGSYPENHFDGNIFYDSNDASHSTGEWTANITIKNNATYKDGTIYYFCVYPYTYKYTEKVYTETNVARCTATPIQLKGTLVMTESDTYDLPVGVSSIDLFIVGGGAGGYINGGGSGYTKTINDIDVSSITSITAIIGAGGAGGTKSAGGATSVIIGNNTYTANGGMNNSSGIKGGAGGSGGGGSSIGVTTMSAGDGGTDGSDGNSAKEGTTNYPAGAGQGLTTAAFSDSDSTIYSGAGGGMVQSSITSGSDYTISYHVGRGGSGGGGNGGALFYSGVATNRYPTDGTPGTGGGGGAGGALSSNNSIGFGAGGSGVAILRWGY